MDTVEAPEEYRGSKAVLIRRPSTNERIGTDFWQAPPTANYEKLLEARGGKLFLVITNADEKLYGLAREYAERLNGDVGKVELSDILQT